MKFNLIVNDIIDWIRRILWYKENKVKKKPYEILEVVDGAHGFIKKVDRDTPRAVLTYIYTPYPIFKENMNKTVQPVYDYHICLDHLWALDNPELHNSFRLLDNTQSFKIPKARMLRRMGDATHRISVLQASRYLDKEGNYITKTLFSNDYDFVGRDSPAYRDKYAIPVLKDVIRFLTTKEIYNFDWSYEISVSQRYFMGGKYVNAGEKETKKETKDTRTHRESRSI